jgi:hypothetical protein
MSNYTPLQIAMFDKVLSELRTNKIKVVFEMRAR